ncbi:MarR family winged helix-turn-helix transcriptional regulator [Granulosicoccaceae sp. 1_MG-2023]|nr:MarR family winged helix-turn-helix transcriptional regulator [Granulosicoccaceae sp. 1_MG-2023]
MSPPLSSDIAAFAVLELAHAFRTEFERQVSQSSLPLTPGEARVLAHVGRYEPVRPGQLAATLGISKMSVSEFTCKLEKGGYLQRSNDPDDQRAISLQVTEAGRAVLGQIRAIGRSVRERARGELPETDWAGFVAMAVEIRKNLIGDTTPRSAV